MNENDSENHVNQQTEAAAKTIAKVFAGVRRLPNGSVIKVEQSDALNIKVTVGNAQKSDVMVLSPLAARTLSAMLSGCLNSQP